MALWSSKGSFAFICICAELCTFCWINKYFFLVIQKSELCHLTHSFKLDQAKLNTFFWPKYLWYSGMQVLNFPSETLTFSQIWSKGKKNENRSCLTSVVILFLSLLFVSSCLFPHFPFSELNSVKSELTLFFFFFFLG